MKSELINCSAASAARGDGSTWGEAPAALQNGPGAPVTFPERCQRDTGNRKPAGFIGQLNQASAEPFQLLCAEPQLSAGLFATTAPTQSPGQGELPPLHSPNSALSSEILSVFLLGAEHLENVPGVEQTTECALAVLRQEGSRASPDPGAVWLLAPEAIAHKINLSCNTNGLWYRLQEISVS